MAICIVPAPVTADTTAPVVISVTYSAASAVPGDTITIYADITDDTDGANIEMAGWYFQNPNGDDTELGSMDFNSGTQLWEADVTINPYWMIGNYTTQMWVEDTAGNSKMYTHGVDGWESGKIWIDGTTPDTEDPVIHSVTYDRSTVYVWESFRVYANITDNLAGIKFCAASVYRPDGSDVWGTGYSDVGLTYNSQSGFYEATFTTNTDWEEGNWYIGRIYCHDEADNRRHQYDGTDFTADRIFMDRDLEGPDLHEVSMSPTVVKVDESTLVRVNLTDAMNEVDTATVEFQNHDTPQTWVLGLSPNGGFWELNMTLDASWHGRNTLNEIYAVDTLGNAATYILDVNFLLEDLSVYDPAIDTDGDGLPDAWEAHYQYDPLVAGDEVDDNDTDGLSALNEYLQGTDPKDGDTDDDGIGDGNEWSFGFDPLDPDENDNGILDGDDDEDGDTLTNILEITLGNLDPTLFDTDGDCLDDGYEYNLSLEGGHGHTGYSYWLVDDVLVDHDADGLNWIEEYNIGSHIEFADTDSDTLNDFDEYFVHFTDPCKDDTDNDTLRDDFEINTSKTNPRDPDTDHDLITDDLEWNTEIFYDDVDGNPLSDYTNATLYDTDNDGLSDYIELVKAGTVPFLVDSDFDGISDYNEYYLYNSSPMANDTDNDDLSDYFEIFTSKTNANASDSDLDGLDDYEEYYTSLTDPWLNDTDNDGLNDYDEFITHGTNPFEADEDNDTLIDSLEVAFGSLTNDNDTDDDLFSDAYEYLYGLNPLLNETYLDLDGDGLICIMEFYNNTHPNNADPDVDGLNDYYELLNGTDPWNPDTDSDLILDGDEVLIYETSPLYEDTDDDGIGDYDEIHNYVSDPRFWSSDEDDLSDYDEIFTYKTDCLDNDTDGDGIDDWAEIFDTLTDPNRNDSDFDGLSDFEEIYTYLTDPHDPDCDDDGLVDGMEIAWLTDPYDPDTDDDFLKDGKEIEMTTNPKNNDTDGDTLADGYEVYELGSDPLSQDTDSDSLPDVWEAQFGLKISFDDRGEDPDEDGLNNKQEYDLGTDPTKVDTDSDGVGDGEEVDQGYDPLDPDSTPQKDFSAEVMSEPGLVLGAIAAFIASIFMGIRSFGGRNSW